MNTCSTASPRKPLFVCLPAFIVTALAAPVTAEEPIRVDADRIERHIIELSAFGRNPQGGVDRVAYSDADLDARRYISGLMNQAGLKVRIDAAGNIIGRREGREDGRALMIGSAAGAGRRLAVGGWAGGVGSGVGSSVWKTALQAASRLSASMTIAAPVIRAAPIT